jgi:hypothetical protein
MSTILGALKHQFQKLIQQNAAPEPIIALLLPLQDNTNLSVDDQAWLLWNLCDCYALLRDAPNQYSYQVAFHRWSITSLAPERLHWVTSDATQACTLIAAEFGDEWWEWYLYANTHATCTAFNRTARFESHRANASAHLKFGLLSRAQVALSHLESVLSESETWDNMPFATVTFYTFLIEWHTAQKDEHGMQDAATRLLEYLDRWQAQVNTHISKQVNSEALLLGSWEQINANRSADAVWSATHNAACVLARSREFVLAERCFRYLCQCYLWQVHYSLTPYAYALYMWVCWENRHELAEIQSLWNFSPQLSAHQIKQFAPELSPVLGIIDS